MGRLKKNLLYQTAYQILAIALPLVTTPVVTRSLGAGGLGQYSYTSAIVNYFSIFALLGVSNYGTREIARAKACNDKKLLNRTFWGIYSLQMALSFVVLILYYIYVLLLAKKFITLALIQGIVLLSTLTDVSWLYFGLEKFKVTVIRNALIKVVCAVIIIFCIREPDDIYFYAFTMIGSTLLSNLILLAGLRKFVAFVKVGMADVFGHFKPNLILFIPVIASSIYVYLDKIMLGNISGSIQNGYYEAMEKIINVPVACITALTTVMFPRISMLVAKNEKEKMDQYINFSLNGICWFSIACIFGMLSVADLFVPMFLGGDFASAALTVTLGCVILLPRGIRGAIKSEYLLPNGKDRDIIFAIFAGAVFNIIANALLMPAYGAVGAVLSTVMSEFISCGIAFFFAREEISVLSVIIKNTPFAIMGFIMFLIINFLKGIRIENMGVRLLFLIIIGVIIYLIMTLVYLFYLKHGMKKRSFECGN